MIGITVGHYRVLERLGGGGMGVVYRAEDTKLGRMVALKFLPPELTRDDEARKRFLREARSASQLDHSNICTVYEIGEADGKTWIAMAYYDGETLKRRIERGPVAVDEALTIAGQIARGLGKAHASGIVHRDVKPANVMLTRDGVVKILDFGLAKLAGGTSITNASQTLGTLAWMAPEQLLAEPVGPQADLWALGVVLFELLTGERPFGGELAQAVAFSILNEQPRSLAALRPDAPPGLDRIVRKLLRKDPLQRYQGADEVIAELEGVRKPDSGSGKSGGRESREREAMRTGARLGPYEIVEPLGSGGMGDVYRARDTRLDRQVAIKVLSPEFSEDSERRQRFRLEAKTISSLSHPGICTLFDVGEQEGIDYLVMEYLEGETLAERIARGPLPLVELLKTGIQIGEALGRAHQQGVVHRDLKPGNVMLTKAGAVKLVDFGLAKGIASVLEPVAAEGGRAFEKMTSNDDDAPATLDPPAKPLTAEGAIVGTLAYMAPEQVEGREADARSDIFAFGAILYEMATGRRAFEGETKANLIAAILTQQPPLLDEPPRSTASASGPRRTLATIEHLVRRCLDKDPDRRAQSALDVANELRWTIERGTGAEASRRGRPGATHVRWWRYATLLLASLLVVTFAYLISGARGAPKSPAGRSQLHPKLVALTWEKGNQHSPVISPDAATFLYVNSTTAGNLDIYSRRVGGEASLNLTKDSEVGDGTPSFSPDGQSIVFRSEREGGGLFVMGATGESVRRLTQSGRSPDWSPVGNQILYGDQADSRTGANPGLWIVDADTGVRRQVFESRATSPVWSPSGQRIAFVAADAKEPGYWSIWTMPAAGGEARVVVPKVTLVRILFAIRWEAGAIWYRAPAAGVAGIWRVRVDEATGSVLSPAELVHRDISGVKGGVSVSDDGSRVLFGSGFGGSSNIERYRFDPSREVRPTDGEEILGGSRVHYVQAVSPDGEWLATSMEETFDGQTDIVLVSTTTGETKRLTNDASFEYDLVWSPDGSKIYYSASLAGKEEVWSIHPDGSERELVASAPGDENVHAVKLSSDGRELFVWVSGPGFRFRSCRVDLSVPVAQRRLIPLPPVSEDRGFQVIAVSPDGKWLAGLPTDSNFSEDDVLVLYDVERNEYRNLPGIKHVAGAGISWLPDSRRLLVSTNKAQPRGLALSLVDRETGAVRSLGEVRTHSWVPNELVLAADGRSFYVNASAADPDLDVWMLDYRSEE
jgi:serine/threonine protein kinase/Tol biopolymer transport system component